jgi:hypothetical protein
MTILIEAKTGAATSDTIDINMERKGTAGSIAAGNHPVGSTFRVTGGALGSGEYVKLQYSDGTNWIDANIAGDDGKILDEDNSVRAIYGRMTNVRLSKSETAAARGVEVV